MQLVKRYGEGLREATPDPQDSARAVQVYILKATWCSGTLPSLSRH